MDFYQVRLSAISPLGSELWAELRHDWRAITFLVLLQAVILLATWLAARLLVPRRELNSFGQYEGREGGSLGRALALYLGYLLLAAVTVAALRYLSPAGHLALLKVLSGSTQVGARWLTILGLAALLLLTLQLALPIAVFRLRLPRAFVMVLLIGLLVAAGGWGLDLALGRPVEQRIGTVRQWAAWRGGHGAQPLTDHARAEADLLFNAAEHTGADPAQPLRDRKEAVRSLFQQLEEIRTHLPEGDPAALAEYDRKKQRYEALLHKLRTEIAAQPAAAE